MLYLFSILLVATIVTGVMILFLLGSPENTAALEVRPSPEGSVGFFLDEGKFEVWHRVSSPDSEVEIRGPGNHQYFSGFTGSASDSGFWGDDEYRLIGTFKGEAGKYRAYSEEGTVILINDTTTVFLMTLLFGTLLVTTIVYYLHIVPPKRTR